MSLRVMPRKKSIKINEANSFKNVFSIYDENSKDYLFKYLNENPLTLEIGCGHGDFTFNLAKEFQNRNFIGLDIKSSRIWRGAKKSLESGITNSAFLVGRAEFVGDFFCEKIVNEIYIPFPDPHVKRRSEKKRLVSEKFLYIYKKILKDDGIIHFKTDNTGLFEYSLEVLEKLKANIFNHTFDLHSNESENLVNRIKTTYEKHYIEEGRKIKYVCFGF